jgi:serine/threonine protein kinase
MSFYANRRKGIFNFLKLSQQNNDENQDNLNTGLEHNLESDWEEAAKEFGSEPISEEEYLESVSLDPEFGRQKYILTWLNKHGIKIFNTGKKGWLGQGSNGIVYNGIVDGKDCVVKVSDEDSDCENWNKILKIKDGMPEELKRHIPEVYKIISEHLPEMHVYQNNACVIAMERLLPIPHDIKVMFGKTDLRFRRSIYDNVDSISKDIYNLLPGFRPSEDDIKEKIIDYLRDNKNLNLNIYDLAKYLPISPIYRWEITSKLLNYSTFPLNFDDDTDYAYNAATESLYKALKWLEKNGIGWGDLHYENIMMDKNGTLKIMDVGMFQIITKRTMRINKFIDIYKTI